MNKLINVLILENNFEILIVIICVVILWICLIKKCFGNKGILLDIMMLIGCIGIWACILFTL